ncbi:MAG: pro-sigmaK processing inhibitor BofA family protein [Clostridia bacterium]|nr:pro-sigmaK processing inhibitor BofA family protein [Clostridia bacterium]
MKIIKSFLGSAFFGILALTVLHLLLPYTGVSVPICRLSLAVAALLGVPGVTAMVLFQLF